jgi:glycosyltransferase involved in cell wall biosynthesis
MKTILLINNLYSPTSFGGAETVVWKLAQKHLRKHRKVVVVTLADNGKFSKNNEEGVVVYRIPAFNIFTYQKLSQKNFVFKLLWHFVDKCTWFGKKTIEKILIDEAPDLVHTHNLTGVGMFVPSLLRKMNIVHIHTLHDVQLVEPSGILLWNHKRDTFWQKIYSKITKFWFQNPDTVYYPSVFIRDFYKNRGFFEKSLWRITNNEFLSQNKIVKKKTGRVKFLFVGKLTKYKGLQTVLDVWINLSKEFDVELHIAGDGKMYREVEKLAKEDNRVFVYGRLNKEDLNNLYTGCNILIFASICMENRPNVILEALENGLFVIASDTGGVNELVNKQNALLFTPGNTKKLQQAISYCI